MFPAKYAKSDIAPSQTDSSLVSAKESTIFRVVGGFLVCAATATTIVFNSKPIGSGTSISSTIFCGANGGLIMPSVAQVDSGEPPFGYFQTNKGEGLSATTGSGSSVGVSLVYVEIK